MTAVFYNKKLNETYVLGGVTNIKHAHKIYKTVCDKMDWNSEMFNVDVVVLVL